jgi:hypothetical protein
MKWKHKIDEWHKGIPLKYPPQIKSRFFYETYVLDKNMENTYNEVFIENKNLKDLDQDYSSFSIYIDKSKNKYVTLFSNLSNSSILIIPMPKKNKDFTTIKDFIDNSSHYHQKIFWKKVSNEIKKILKTEDKIYVSTHGLGVPYFHLRLDKVPKYYETKEFIY